MSSQLLLTLALVSVFGGILSNAIKCGANTIKFQHQYLGQGHNHVTTTDVSRTGAQKQFRQNEKIELGMALLMEKEGLYSPIIEVCSNEANLSHTYLLTTVMMDKPIYSIVTDYRILYGKDGHVKIHNIANDGYNITTQQMFDGQGNQYTYLLTDDRLYAPTNTQSSELLSDYLSRWIQFYNKYSGTRMQNDVISWDVADDYISNSIANRNWDNTTVFEVKTNIMRFLKDNNMIFLNKYVISWIHSGNTMLSVAQNKLYCVDADWMSMYDNTEALNIVTDRVFDGHIHLEMSPYVPPTYTATERITNAIMLPFNALI